MLACSCRWDWAAACKLRFTKMNRELYWNPLLRLVIEMYFELLIICGIRMKIGSNLNAYETSLTVFSWISGAALLAFAGVVLWLVLRFREKMDDDEIEEKYGTLFEDLDLSKDGSSFNIPVFIAVRVAFVLVLILLQPYPGIQVVLVTYIALAQTAFIAFTWPYETRVLNATEFVN